MIFKVSGQRFEPTKLLADAAWQIKNGFRRKWPDALILMCWYHVSVKVKERAKKDFTNEQVRKDLINDLRLLQLSQNKKVFLQASNLFLKKYKSSQSFVDYFKAEWLVKNPNWYEGASGTNPSTQCAQESTHGKIKQTFTHNERLSMSEMKNLCGEIVSNFSLDLLNQKKYASSPDISSKEMQIGYEWAKSKQDIVRDPEDSDRGSTQTWWVSAKPSEKLTKPTINKVKKMTWTTFDAFKNTNFSAFKIEIQNETVENSIKVTCTCAEFLKNYKCVHSVGVSINQKFITVSQEVKTKYKEKIKENVNLPNNSGRQRGRPKKATPALVK